MPPLLDYPNHLARAVVLAAGASDPILSRMYAPHWAIIPNLGTDLVLPPLLHLLPVHLAGRIVVGIAILLPVLGTLAYSRAVFGFALAWPLGSGACRLQRDAAARLPQLRRRHRHGAAACRRLDRLARTPSASAPPCLPASAWACCSSAISWARHFARC